MHQLHELDVKLYIILFWPQTCKTFQCSTFTCKKNHIVEDGSGDIIVPKHLVNPTKHSLVRHLERISSYFWLVTFLTCLKIFLSQNGIIQYMMVELKP